MPQARTSKSDNVLYLGVDLGTSRSVVSASNGRREWVESYVGWPKDFVAQKMLGRPVLFGGEALQHRLSLNLYRPLESGVIREGTEQDEEAVMELIGHLVELAQAKAGERVFAAIGVPAEALKVNKLAIKQAVKKYADSLIVVSEPFSVAYGLGVLDNSMVIDIGAGTVDFCIMHGTMPGEDDQRSLFTAGDYVDSQLFNLLAEKYPQADFTLTMVQRYKEEFGFVGPPPQKVEIEVPVHGKFVVHDITVEMRRACESIMPSIAETAMDMIAKFDAEFQGKVRNNIILAGGGSQLKGIAAYLKEAFHEFEPCNFAVVDDPLYAGVDGALELAKDMPDEYWEKI
jgi:rod shape-determining protein MreB